MKENSNIDSVSNLKSVEISNELGQSLPGIPYNSLNGLPYNSLNGTAGVSSTSELIWKTVETLIQQSVLLELEKNKARLAMDQQKEKTNSSKIKSPVKRKSKHNRNYRENDEKRKK